MPCSCLLPEERPPWCCLSPTNYRIKRWLVCASRSNDKTSVSLFSLVDCSGMSLLEGVLERQARFQAQSMRSTREQRTLTLNSKQMFGPGQSIAMQSAGMAGTSGLLVGQEALRACVISGAARNPSTPACPPPQRAPLTRSGKRQRHGEIQFGSKPARRHDSSTLALDLSLLMSVQE